MGNRQRCVGVVDGEYRVSGMRSLRVGEVKAGKDSMRAWLWAVSSV